MAGSSAGRHGRFSRVGAIRILSAAVVLLFLAIWIVVPAPVYWLLPFGIAAPEASPLLLASAVIVGIVGVRMGNWPGLLAALICASAALLASLPLIQLRSTLQRFDADTAAATADATSAPAIDSVSITRGIVFAEPDGKPLTLDLYRPGSDHLFPVVVQIYGGAWRSGGPGDDAGFAAGLAQQGFLVAAIDYRHAPQARWPAQINDVRAAIEWVIAHAGEYGGDSQHLGLVGRSSGAQLALIAAYTDPERVSAVVSYYGPTDLAAGWRHPPSPDPLPVRPVLEAFLGGTPDEVPQRYQAASPITYADRPVPPTLLVYGARDHIVEARFGRDLHEALRASGARSIYLELPWAEHAFDKVPGLGARVTLPYVERFLSSRLH